MIARADLRSVWPIEKQAKEKSNNWSVKVCLFRKQCGNIWEANVLRTVCGELLSMKKTREAQTEEVYRMRYSKKVTEWKWFVKGFL